MKKNAWIVLVVGMLFAISVNAQSSVDNNENATAVNPQRGQFIDTNNDGKCDHFQQAQAGKVNQKVAEGENLRNRNKSARGNRNGFGVSKMGRKGNCMYGKGKSGRPASRAMQSQESR